MEGLYMLVVLLVNSTIFIFRNKKAFLIEGRSSEEEFQIELLN